MPSCVDVLDRYVTELRTYMKRYPWPAGGTTSSSSTPAVEAPEDEWEQLTTEVCHFVSGQDWKCFTDD